MNIKLLNLYGCNSLYSILVVLIGEWKLNIFTLNPFFFFLMYVCMYVCMYVWLCWVFVSVRGPSLVAASGGHSSLRCRGHSSSQCAGLSLPRPLVAEHRLQTRRLSNCGSRAELLRGMWDPPRPGLEPASPALAGRFSTTAPPGKPLKSILIDSGVIQEWGIS